MLRYISRIVPHPEFEGSVALVFDDGGTMRVPSSSDATVGMYVLVAGAEKPPMPSGSFCRTSGSVVCYVKPTSILGAVTRMPKPRLTLSTLFWCEHITAFPSEIPKVNDGTIDGERCAVEASPPFKLKVYTYDGRARHVVEFESGMSGVDYGITLGHKDPFLSLMRHTMNTDVGEYYAAVCIGSEVVGLWNRKNGVYAEPTQDRWMAQCLGLSIVPVCDKTGCNHNHVIRTVNGPFIATKLT